MQRWLGLVLIGAAMSPALAAAPDPMFKPLPGVCLADQQGVEGTAYSDQIDRLDESLDDSDPKPACGLSQSLLPTLAALKDRLAQCRGRAGAAPAAERLAESVAKVDQMMTHVRAAMIAVHCGGF